jgi:toxin ParE1/3/4
LRVRFSRRAAADLVDIVDYLMLRNAAVAKSVAADIRATIRRTGEMPLSGRAQEEFELRRVVTRKYSYIVYYRIADAVEIVTIQSGSQNREYSDT